MRVDFESLPNDHLIATELPEGVTDSDIQLVRLNDTLVSMYDREHIDHLIATELPEGVTDSDTQLVRLNDTLVSM